MHYNIKWFYIYNVAVCCILSVFLWRYPEHVGNKEYMTNICYRCALLVCYVNLDTSVISIQTFQ
jgi:hypothetical protein